MDCFTSVGLGVELAVCWTCGKKKKKTRSRSYRFHQKFLSSQEQSGRALKIVIRSALLAQDKAAAHGGRLQPALQAAKFQALPRR